MRKFTVLFLFVSFFNYGTLFAQISEEPQNSREIKNLNGTVTLVIEKFEDPFNGISYRFTDMNINKQTAGYFTIRKRGNSYRIKGRRYSNLENGIMHSTKELFEGISDMLYGDKDIFWAIFSEENIHELIIDIILGFIDDEFISDYRPVVGG
jgi:hypothetical protein